MTRQAFDPNATDAPPPPPKRLRYPCRVEDCPMPGTMFEDTGGEGICPWHWHTTGNERARITQTMHHWRALTDEINRARRVLTDPEHCTDIRYHNECMATAWRTLAARTAASWHLQLAPQPSDEYGRWCRRLEHFLDLVIAGKAKPEKEVA